MKRTDIGTAYELTRTAKDKDERRAAATEALAKRAVAKLANDPEDERLILEMLGLSFDTGQPS